MSCRRRDKENFIGCKIGDVALRGCSRGCCPYPDSDIFENTHPNLLNGYRGPLHDPALQSPGRTGLYYRASQSPYFPKFICPKPTCRRSIKPFYDPEKHEYKISDYQDWKIRPATNSEAMVRVKVNQRRLKSRGYCDGLHGDERKRYLELRSKWMKEEGSLSKDELEELKEFEPEAWWVTLIEMPRMAGYEEVNMKRCPSCGGEA